MVTSGQNERELAPFTEIAQHWQEKHGYRIPSNKKDAPVAPAEKDSTIDKRLEDRLWEGFQKERRLFLGVSVALILYLWGNVDIEKLALFGGSFVIQDEWTFKLLIIVIWVLLGWRYWTYEKEMVKEEFQGEFDNIRQEKLRQVLIPHLKGLLEEEVRPEIQKGIDPPPESGFHPWPEEDYERSEEKEEFTLLSTSWGKSEFRARKQVAVGDHIPFYDKELNLEIRRYRNLVAYVKSWMYLAMRYRHVSDYKGPYVVAIFVLIGLIKKVIT